jgi:hypothetical protein
MYQTTAPAPGAHSRYARLTCARTHGSPHPPALRAADDAPQVPTEYLQLSRWPLSLPSHSLEPVAKTFGLASICAYMASITLW